MLFIKKLFVLWQSCSQREIWALQFGWEKCALFIDNASFKLVLISNSSAQDLMSCAELIISILNMVKGSNECKWYFHNSRSYVFLKSILSKNVIFSFKSVVTKCWDCPVVEVVTPLQGPVKKIKDNLSPALSWEIFCLFSTPVVKNADIL